MMMDTTTQSLICCSILDGILSPERLSRGSSSEIVCVCIQFLWGDGEGDGGDDDDDYRFSDVVAMQTLKNAKETIQ